MDASLDQAAAQTAPDQSGAAVTKAGLLTSKYTGVCWNKKNKRWQASINSGGKYLYLGSFQSEDDAAQTFDLAAIKLRGTKTKTNFPLETYMDADGQLMENEALNATIAVHEQLVLTQKLATAQALALAGVTKKPRAGGGGGSGGGAGTAAKKLTKANPASQGIITANPSAAAGSSRNSGPAAAGMGMSVSGAPAAVVQSELLEDSSIAKHISANFDLALLQQAATSAATNAVLATAEQQRQQQQQAYGCMPGVSGPQQELMQQQMMFLQQQAAMGPLQQSMNSSIPAVSMAQTMQQLQMPTSQPWPAGALQQAAYPAADGNTILPGVPVEDGQQQHHQAASRAMYMSSLQGYPQDPALSQAVSGAMAATLPDYAQHMQPMFASAVAQLAASNSKRPSSSGNQRPREAAQQHQSLLGAAAARAVGPGTAAAAAAAAAGDVPIIRLSVLCQHLPAGGQLQMLMPGERGLCGVIYSIASAQANESWATALWDGCEWHAGGSFSTEESAISACQFAVNFAKQLALSTPSGASLPTAAGAQQTAAVGVQHHDQQQQQTRDGSATDRMSQRALGWQQGKVPRHSSSNSRGSTQQAATATVLEERSSLDELAAAAAGALHEQQQREWHERQEHFVQQEQQLRGSKQPSRRGRLTKQPGVDADSQQQMQLHAPAAAAVPALLPDHHCQQDYNAGVGLQQQLPGQGAASYFDSLAQQAKKMQQQAGQLAVADTQAWSAQQQQQPDYLLQQSEGGQDTATQAQDSQPLQQSSSSGVSGALLQLLQQVASGETITPQQSLNLIDSLKQLMGGGSDSYESLLYDILGGNSSAAAFGEYSRLFDAPETGLSPAAEQRGSGMGAPTQQLQASQDAFATAAAPAAASAALDDFGAFGSESGLTAAAAASAAAGLDSALKQCSKRPAAASGMVLRESNNSSLSLPGSASGNKRLLASFGSSALQSRLSVQPGVIHKASTGRDRVSTPSVTPEASGVRKQMSAALEAYLQSMKDHDQQQQAQQEQQAKKRRKTETSTLPDLDTGQQRIVQQHITSADGLSSSMNWATAAAQIQQETICASERPDSSGALPSSLTALTHFLVNNVASGLVSEDANACTAAGPGSMKFRDSITVPPKQGPSKAPAPAGRLQATVPDAPDVTPMTAYKVEKASGTSPVSSLTQGGAAVGAVSTPKAALQTGKAITSNVASRPGPAVVMQSNEGVAADIRSVFSDQLATMLAEMVASGHEVRVEELVSLLSNRAEQI